MDPVDDSADASVDASVEEPVEKSVETSVEASVENSPEMSKQVVKSVSRNPLSNLQTLLRDRFPNLRISSPGMGVVVGISILLNLVLFWAVVSFGTHFFRLRDSLAGELASAKSLAIPAGAQIETTIEIHDELPVSFDLPLQRDTLVTLTQPTRIEDTTLSIRSATLSIDAPAAITLPVGAELPITLDLSVPVTATVPVDLTVPITVPLAGSALGDSIASMQGLVDPLQQIVAETPGCWQMLLWGGNCP